MNINEVIEIVKEEKFDVYAVRCGSNGAEIGEILDNSHDWFQDADNIEGFFEMTEEEQDAIYNADFGCYDGGELNGVSCIRINEENVEEVIERVSKIYGISGEIVLVGGYDYEEGNDVDEIILANAKRLM